MNKTQYKAEKLKEFRDEFADQLINTDEKTYYFHELGPWEDIEAHISSLIDTTIARCEEEKDGALITSRRFWLVRTEDVSGVSGTGAVADGVVFPDGVTILQWRTMGGSTGVYKSIESMIEIHGHNGATKVEFINSLTSPTEEGEKK